MRVKRYEQTLYNFGLRMCRDVSDSAYLTCRDIENHARDCIKCHTCLETLKRTIDLYKNMENKPVPEQYSLRLKEFVQTLS